MKRILQIITVLGVGTFVVVGIMAITQTYFTHASVAPWENWIIGLSAIVSSISGVFQISAVSNAFRDIFTICGQGIINAWNTITALPLWTNILIIVLLVAIIFLAGGNFVSYKQMWNNVFTSSTPTPAPTATPTLDASACLIAQKAGIRHGLGVTVQGKDCIGLSNGNAVFDTNHPDEYVKDALLAVEANIKDAGSSQTMAGWDHAPLYDQTNAEPRIYDEDIHVLHNSRPHVTIVVVAILTGIYYNDGRDVLQGAYLQQKEQNDACRNANYHNCLLLNVIIANVGSGVKDESDYANLIADQIRKAQQNDPTIVGVMSGINSQGTLNLNNELNKSGGTPPPIIAAKATYDNISGESHLFRVVPPNSVQALTASKYARDWLHVSRVAVLYREDDTYASNLATDFSNDFPSGDGKYQLTSPLPIGYTPRDTKSLTDALQKILQDPHHPDALYCACYANEVNILLQQLAHYPQYKQLLILGGDALYELGDYTPDTRAQMYRLRFTSFTYPDIWSILSSETADPPPLGIKDYKDVYGKNAGDGQYGTTRMTPGVSVSYDAMLVFMTSCNKIFASQSSISASDLENGSNSIVTLHVVGISGHITFVQPNTNTAANDPYDKIIVVIRVVYNSDGLHFQYAGFHEGSL